TILYLITRRLSLACGHLPQVMFVPCSRDRFARRIRSRHIRARRDSLLTQLAHVPVLFVGQVPELDRVRWFEMFSAERVWMKKPIAHDQRFVRRLGPKLVHHHVFGMQAEKHVREDRIIEYALKILDLSNERRA